MTMDKLIEQARPQAIKNIKTRLAMEAVAVAENITVSDEELEAEYTKMADDTVFASEQQRDNTIKAHQELKDGTVEAISDMQSEIDGILVESGNDFKGYTGKTGKEVGFVADNIENMSTRVYGALVDMDGNFITSAANVDKQSKSIQNDIDAIQGKEVSVTVRFKSINFQQVKQQVESAGSHVYSAGIPSYYKDYLDGLPANFGDIYEQDLYGLKDANVKTISLSSLKDGISAYATRDSNASMVLSNAVANYNYNNSTSIVRESVGSLSVSRQNHNDNTNGNNGALINIENMTVRNDNDIKEIAKQLENYIRLHSKKW
jgi:hypothetical protein